jgi:rubredoxin
VRKDVHAARVLTVRARAPREVDTMRFCNAGLQKRKRWSEIAAMPGQKHTSMPSDPNCPLCTAWCHSPCERAFSSGLDVDPLDAHRMLVLGYWCALADMLIRPVCSIHRKQLEQLDNAKSALEKNEALQFKRPS